jgi:hypothetical protein
MNRYILIRRLTGPAVLLLLGVVALLHQADLVSWSVFIPLLLILIGVLKLAQRAALAAAGDEPMYPGAPYSYSAGSPPPGPAQTTPQTGTSIAPASGQEFGRGSEERQS